MTLTNFQKKLFRYLPKKGKVISYGELARKVNSGPRAVARALAANPYPVKIACHRVICSDGSLGGYSGIGGVAGKKRLLRKEGVDI